MRPIIDIITSPYCGGCDKAKAQIAASSPESHGVTVNVQEVGEDSGRTEVPWMMIGDTNVVGYNEARISDALSTLYAALDAEKQLVEPETPGDDQQEAPPQPVPPKPKPVVVQPQTASIAKPTISRGAVLVFSICAGFVLAQLVSSD